MSTPATSPFRDTVTLGYAVAQLFFLVDSSWEHANDFPGQGEVARPPSMLDNLAADIRYSVATLARVSGPGLSESSGALLIALDRNLEDFNHSWFSEDHRRFLQDLEWVDPEHRWQYVQPFLPTRRETWNAFLSRFEIFCSGLSEVHRALVRLGLCRRAIELSASGNDPWEHWPDPERPLVPLPEFRRVVTESGEHLGLADSSATDLSTQGYNRTWRETGARTYEEWIVARTRALIDECVRVRGIAAERPRPASVR